MKYRAVPVRGGHWTPTRKRVIVARVLGGERIDELAAAYALEPDEIQAWVDADARDPIAGLYITKRRPTS